MEQQRDFKGVWISKEIWLDKRLSMLEKGILTEICSLDCEESGCYASNKYLAEFCQCSEASITKAISKLKELGFIYEKSFDGRTRILKTCIGNFTRQTSKIYEAEYENLRPNNIDNNINNIKERKKDGKYDEIINSNLTDEDVKVAVYEFIKMRKLIKKPMTDRALSLMLNKLHKLANNKDVAIKILEQSILNNWQDIYELKQDKTTKPRENKYTENNLKRNFDNIFTNIADVEI